MDSFVVGFTEAVVALDMVVSLVVAIVVEDSIVE